MKPNTLKTMVDSYNNELVYREMADEAKTNDEWIGFVKLANKEADIQMAMALVVAEYEDVTVDDVLCEVIDEWEKIVGKKD